MGEEIIYVTIISSVFSLIGLITYFNLSTRKMKLESELNIKRFKVGKQYKIKEMQLPQQVDTRGPKDRAIDGLVTKLADRYLKPQGEEEGEEELSAEGILGGISDYLEANPQHKKTISKLINQALGGDKDEQQEIKLER